MALFDLPLAELERYRPQVVEPDDLDAFWGATLTEARGLGDDVRLERVATGLTLVDTWDVTFPGFGGHPVRAWYTRPAGVDAPLPAVVEFLGYGRGRGLPGERLTWSNAGYAHLLVDTRGQGGQHGNGGDTPDPVGSGPAAPGFVTRGILDPSTAYYRRVYTDGVRAVDAVRTLPGVDPSRVAALGNSQGGGIALAVAGLVPDLAAVAASAPFLCHVERALALTDADPYAEVVRYLAVHRGHEAQVLRTLSYLDGVHLVRRARAAALFGTGLRDTVCPPSTAFAAFHAYADDDPSVPREIAVYPFNHHEGGDAHHVARVLSWFATHLTPPG
ncbi:acetylxylan esterase [Cellulomonas fimi]|uniref:Cephalosporin-C deacetylase n=1 Tax=Cellulomonas fimi (strain ATCC 484 / DSM 20113 / JCM 1341 / CCUG 24087 / LMG 16345 / NBRC 15513 / NCIMB 8980 / NCTC 7547 / NRS-133) TaxID=590998 RepID=F4H122_CELFA|nr:acetylxylan esterase [Cellulomonas fimi]AEE47391.1 Cephalosporin-C deacetylase [Cellulomonas fimi ATCC 484]NNH05779.1 prolyl oligopeptidase family serine peptidase [Cellulomonas fimi]VEH36087.1 Cephalosporin C deacetylase [Cellulomonas fimi]